MELVNDLKNLKENIELMNKYIQDEGLKKEFALDRIKRGTCFLTVQNENGYSFYPSRFVGYKNNNYDDHIKNAEKDGRDTNAAINELLGYKPYPSEELENEYKRFCERLGFTASERGAFGVERKYWMLKVIS